MARDDGLMVTLALSDHAPPGAGTATVMTSNSGRPENVRHVESNCPTKGPPPVEEPAGNDPPLADETPIWLVMNGVCPVVPPPPSDRNFHSDRIVLSRRYKRFLSSTSS